MSRRGPRLVGDRGSGPGWLAEDDTVSWPGEDDTVSRPAEDDTVSRRDARTGP